jgi:septum formation topological specificity factor MinE
MLARVRAWLSAVFRRHAKPTAREQLQLIFDGMRREQDIVFEQLRREGIAKIQAEFAGKREQIFRETGITVGRR